MNLILVSSALITVLFSVGSHASNVDRDTINWLTPNTVDASVKHPEVTEKICALLLEGAQLERELVSNRAEELSFEAMIAEARVGLNAVGRLTDKAFPQDFGQRKGPSKLIRRVRRERRQLDREVATFRRDFDARVIAALAVRSGRFRRVLNRRDRYLDYLNQLAVARRTIEVTHELIVPAEAALDEAPAWFRHPRPWQIARALVRWEATRRYFVPRETHLFEALAWAKNEHMLFEIPTEPRISSSVDLVVCYEVLLRIETEVLNRLKHIDERLRDIVAAAVRAGEQRARELNHQL